MDSYDVGVWWVQCKPFSPSERNSEAAESFQKECLDGCFFGMGWKNENEAFVKYAEHEFNWSIANEFKNAVKNKNFSGAQNLYGQMKKGDVIFTRLSGIYYLGNLMFAPKVSSHNLLSWYAQVDKWTRIGTGEDLPHHVRGKISSKNYQGTAAKIDGLTAWTLKGLAGIACPKQKINEGNFYKSIGDEDLEDLMAHYMSTVKVGYVFLPSSCKKNTPGIEFVMYNPENGNTIACQTKVNRWIDVGQYLSTSAYEKYEKIYLFSGAGYYNYDEDSLNNICFVEPKSLYDIMKSNKHFSDITNKYFDFE